MRATASIGTNLVFDRMMKKLEIRTVQLGVIHKAECVNDAYECQRNPQRNPRKLLETVRRSKNKGIGFSKQEKLRALIELSGVKIPFIIQQPLTLRRFRFDKTKCNLHPWRRFGNCFACGLPATSRHHIVQLQNGGINSKKNLVSLCKGCHAEIHPWLK